jgi:elongation factor Ts
LRSTRVAGDRFQLAFDTARTAAMTNFDAKDVKKLRDMTAAPMMDCKKALTECGGNFDQAKDWLRKKGMASAEKAAARDVNEGKLFSYVHHNGKVAVLVEVVCETDFVAMNEEFNAFGKGLCLTITAYGPQYLDRAAVDPQDVEREQQIVTEQARENMAGKPENVIEKAVAGRMDKFFQSRCLMELGYVNPLDQSDSRTVEEVRKALVGKIGENIQVRRFYRMELGG